MSARAVSCLHCGRAIERDLELGTWVDPEATGDDSVWREVCDAHDTFQAEHEAQARACVAHGYVMRGAWLIVSPDDCDICQTGASR
jgi:hypothetical protein